ncbi:MAG: hypothetical protein JOZ16_01305 [Methylobacteriaceae bacterium]|nr:hypothetical protein [Methylobacteriaceae bacterium]
MNQKVSKQDAATPVSASQFRAGRALLGWSQAELAEAAELSLPTVKRVELETVQVSAEARDKMRHALEAAGIEFTNGKHPGVRMPGDRTYGYLYDEERIVARIKNGELRSDRDGSVMGLVNAGSIHDPATGERICGLSILGLKGKPLPPALKARFPQ